MELLYKGSAREVSCKDLVRALEVENRGYIPRIAFIHSFIDSAWSGVMIYLYSYPRFSID